MNPPKADEYSGFFANYIKLIEGDVITELENQTDTFPLFLRGIPAEKEDYAYAQNKWTVKELIGHIIDTERIMAYRLLRFSRKDPTDLPGFEENLYVANSTFKAREFKDLIDEFELVRKSNLYLIKALTEEQLALRGTANHTELSVKALVFVIAGHLKHHINILTERYL